MKVSLDWIKDYVELPPDVDVERIVHDLTATTVEVEAAIDLSAGLAGVVVGRVASLGPASLARHHIVTCDVGGDDPIKAVSAAANITSGMLVAVALPSANIRSSDASETVTGEPRTVGGVLSEAVICTAAELGLSDMFVETDPASILDLSEVSCSVGDPLGAAIGWDDTVLEIDNKSLTNRPDLWGHYGLARELAAIYGCALKPLPAAGKDFPTESLIGEIDAAACNRFTATRITGVQMTGAPMWMRSRLARLGQRSINLLVDLTNYVMFAVGQPSHAYDADQIALPLEARFGSSGDTIRLLDDKEYEVDSTVLTIADRNGPVGIAGIMGGVGTSLNDQTRDIVLEIANFNALNIRRTSTRLGLRSEASSRYEKSLDTQRIDVGLSLFLDLLRQIQPAAKITGFQDVCPQATKQNSITVDVSFLQERLGEPLPAQLMTSKLQSLGFEVRNHAGSLDVTVPSWRSTGDVTLRHDLIEEVARLYGYDNFEFAAPETRLERQTSDRHVLLERRLKELLAFAGGMQEVVTYPWSKDRFLEAAGVPRASALQLSEAPAPDQSSLRTSLIPNLLESVVINLRFFTSFRIFETGRVFIKPGAKASVGRTESLPLQPRCLAGAIVGANSDALFRQAKGLIEMLKRAAHLESLDFSPDTGVVPWTARAAGLGLTANDQPVGALGVLSSRAKRLAGIKRGSVVLFEINIDACNGFASRENKYRSLPEFPEIDYDLSLVFPNEITWGVIAESVQDAHPLIREVAFVDEYVDQTIPKGKKSITFRLRLGLPTRTLRSEEVNEVGALVTGLLREQFGSEARS